MSFRRLLLSCALAACVALLPTSAAARLTVRVPAERDIADRVIDALSDGELGATDLVDEAFNELWTAIGNTIAEAQICREANVELLSNSRRPATFTVNVTVTGGSADATMAVRMSAMPQGNQVIVKVLRPDGVTVVREIPCPRPYGLTVDDNAPSAATLETRGGANVLAFQTEYGRIITYLPSDMRAGDAISGTVYIEPNGADDGARRDNAARLSGYVVDVGGTQTRVADSVIRFTVGAAPGLIPVVLSNGTQVLGAEEIMTGPAVAGGVENALPAAAQAGEPLGIPGAFDGDVSNTTAQVGGGAAEVVAESPRQVVVMCPPAPTGPVTVSVNDGGHTVTGNTNVVGISLSAPRTTLARGERTQVTLRVIGLQGMQTPLGVALWASPSVSLQGGNTQTVAIDPASANSAGEALRVYQLRVVSPGPFDITATLIQP